MVRVENCIELKSSDAGVSWTSSKIDVWVQKFLENQFYASIYGTQKAGKAKNSNIIPLYC